MHVQPASFWRENMMAVVILLRVLAKMSSGSDGKKLSNLKSFIILRLGEGLNSFNKNNRVIFSGEK